MSKRSVFTTITALPPQVSRETAIEVLHSHTEMIDLNPLVIDRHPIKAPGKATPEEYHCTWYSITDRVSYVPGGLVTSKVTYSACFHDLADGLQTHVYAPAGLDIKEKWSIGGTSPGEAPRPVEIGQGIPLSGLYLREDIDMTCNMFLTSFVKKTLKKAHAKLIARLLVRAQLDEREKDLERMTHMSMSSGSTASPRNNYDPRLHHTPSIHSNGGSPHILHHHQSGVHPPGFQQGRLSSGNTADHRCSLQSCSSQICNNGNYQHSLRSHGSHTGLAPQYSNSTGTSPNHPSITDPAYVLANPYSTHNAFGIHNPGGPAAAQHQQKQFWELQLQQQQLQYGRETSGHIPRRSVGYPAEMSSWSNEDKRWSSGGSGGGGEQGGGQRGHSRHPSDGVEFAVELEAEVPQMTQNVPRPPPIPAKAR